MAVPAYKDLCAKLATAVLCVCGSVLLLSFLADPCYYTLVCGLGLIANCGVGHALKAVWKSPRPQGEGFGMPSTHSMWGGFQMSFTMMFSEIRTVSTPDFAMYLMCVALLAPVFRFLSGRHSGKQTLMGFATGVCVGICWSNAFGHPIGRMVWSRVYSVVSGVFSPLSPLARMVVPDLIWA
ncbi:hypothetical protein KIPB_003364 [Kipferlia bialata]|uniref:Phosphatidic acid phosphatase type 2/haloperoxidase domain-containing protein n=1 Tax=Kipferlia bialata TaxID=797122 RepID=A0A9K3CST9_9EUKA|nr:hypothetical protein KIPB_003364 [Kipferlia bialata]|eukprot:g3364.t1